MFLEKLADSLLIIAEKYNLTYEQIAERCNLSARYVGKIIRRESSPTMKTFEQICIGLGITPDEILQISKVAFRKNIMAYRISNIDNFILSDDLFYSPICPKCNNTIEKEFQNYCESCGHKLDWSKLSYKDSLVYK